MEKLFESILKEGIRENASYLGIIRSPKLFIGDICYALNEDDYQILWGDRLRFNDGRIRNDEEDNEAIVVSTAYGDGSYRGSDGKDYDVDAGNIGVVGSNYFAKDFNEDDDSLGTLIEVPGGDAQVSVSYDNGTIRIVIKDCHGGAELYNVSINTAESDDEYDDEYDDGPWDEDEDEDEYDDNSLQESCEGMSDKWNEGYSAFYNEIDYNDYPSGLTKEEIFEWQTGWDYARQEDMDISDKYGEEDVE